jgi:hypothetical protein
MAVVSPKVLERGQSWTAIETYRSASITSPWRELRSSNASMTHCSINPVKANAFSFNVTHYRMRRKLIDKGCPRGTGAAAPQSSIDGPKTSYEDRNLRVI